MVCNLAPPLFSNVFVARNFLHHNRQQEKGYGVVTGKGGFPLIEGNTFLANRHAIAAAGAKAYRNFARFNLVLSEAPLQVAGDGLVDSAYARLRSARQRRQRVWRTGRLDTTGSSATPSSAPIGPTTRSAGTPATRPTFARTCRWQSPRGVSGLRAVACFFPTKPAYEVESVVNIHVPSQFNEANPTNRLGVGDFDGDGTADMFLATGAAWYYSPGGAREWRYLSNNAAPLSFLRFGDFDGDGRTDVVGVSAGGRSRLLGRAPRGSEMLNAAALRREVRHRSGRRQVRLRLPRRSAGLTSSIAECRQLVRVLRRFRDIPRNQYVRFPVESTSCASATSMATE